MFRTQQQFDGAAKDIAVLKEADVPFELLTPAELAQAEPALAAVSHKLTGGLRLPNDETGDCQMFTTRLAAMASDWACSSATTRRSTRLAMANGRIAGVQCGSELVRGRLVRAWRWARIRRKLLRDLVKIPVYPLKGYSITAPIVERSGRAGFHGARRDLQDRDHPFRRPHSRGRHGGDRRLRQVACSQARRETLEMCVNDLFPGGGDTSKARSGPVCAR